MEGKNISIQWRCANYLVDKYLPEFFVIVFSATSRPFASIRASSSPGLRGSTSLFAFGPFARRKRRVDRLQVEGRVLGRLRFGVPLPDFGFELRGLLLQLGALLRVDHRRGLQLLELLAQIGGLRRGLRAPGSERARLPRGCRAPGRDVD